MIVRISDDALALACGADAVADAFAAAGCGGVVPVVAALSPGLSPPQPASAPAIRMPSQCFFICDSSK